MLQRSVTLIRRLLCTRPNESMSGSSRSTGRDLGVRVRDLGTNDPSYRQSPLPTRRNGPSAEANGPFCEPGLAGKPAENQLRILLVLFTRVAIFSSVRSLAFSDSL